jgi:hypothetical protein
MAVYQVTCITKRGGHLNPHERIERIGGSGWSDSETQAILNIKTGAKSYYVSVNGRPVDVVIAEHEGREYLKTRADDYEPNNLLALRECA